MKPLVLCAAVLAALTVSAVERGINVWYPGETAELRLVATNLTDGAVCEVRALDWLGKTVFCRPYDPSSGGRLSVSFDDVGKRFGAYRVELVRRGAKNAPVSKTAFAFLTSPKVKPVSWIGTGGHPLSGRGYTTGRLEDQVGPYLDMLSAAGVGVFRQDFCWHQVERRGKGRYEIGEAAENLFAQLEKRGIAWQLLMTWKNDLYENPLDPDGFAAFCAWTAKHWKGRAKHYEIFNEPQNTPWREVYPREGRDSNSNLIWVVKFAEFCRKASNAIHAADPQATVAVTGEDVEWLLADMIRKGCAQKDDLISFHPYCHFQPRPEREYWFKDDGRSLRALAAANGGAHRFCISEMGWTTFEGKMKYLEIAGCYPKASLEHQAIYLTRMYLLSRLTGIEYACSYCWKDEGQDPSYTEHHFGQLFYDSTPKPSFAATAYLARLLGDAKPVGELSDDRAKFRLAAFDVGGGKRVVAAWCVEGVCDAALPKSLGELSGARDLFGNEIPPPLAKDGRLRLTEHPVYLFFSAADVRKVELVDFATKPGSFTNGGEFPGAVVKGGFDGASVRVDYDLTKGSYVGWTLAEKIPEGTSALEFRVTNLSDADMGFGFKFTDAQNQHYHGKLVGAKAKPGEKDVLFTAFFDEHDKGWRQGGETDGQVHYPISNVTLMTCRGGGPLVGAFAVGSVRAVTTADASALPDYFLSATPTACGAVWYPGETCEFAVNLKPRTDKAAGGIVRWKLEDWLGADLASGEVKDGTIRLPPAAFKGRVGSFRLRFGVRIGDTKLVRETWLARLTSRDVKPARWVGSLAPEWCYPLVKACGIGRLNTSTEWRISEKKKGEYRLDYLVDRCTNMLAHGIMPAMMIQSRNELYEDQIDKEAFARWAAAVAKRLSAVGVDRIEIWNEPQNFEFRKYYGGDWGENGWITKYIDFTRTVSKAIHEAAPEMTVSVTAEDIEWVLYSMLTRGIAQPWDQISFHPYSHYQIRPEFEYFYRDRGEVIKRLAANYGGAKRLGVSEVGWTTFAGKGEYWEVAGCYPRASYEQQAMYLVRAYLLGVMCGADWTLQYRFDDSGPREEYTEHNFGMVRRDRTPKPSFAAVAFMTRTVGEFTKVEHLPGDLTLKRVGLFTMPDGHRVYAAWAVVDDFKWTVPGDRPFRLYDMMGNELPVPSDRTMILTERPVYVVER